MKLFSSVTIALCSTTVMAHRSWKAPVATDPFFTASPANALQGRSPCPMVNTMANHGYLPRNGLNISMSDLVSAFDEAVNLAAAATQLVGAKALLTSTTGNAATFNLDDLNKHGVIEHDGSLSRSDIALGDNHSFNAGIWASVAAFFTSSTITLPTAIEARKARLTAAAAANPAFNMTAGDVQFSAIETALYMSVFATGNGSVGSEAEREWVQSLFVKERLPYEQGWTRPVQPLTVAGILGVTQTIMVAS